MNNNENNYINCSKCGLDNPKESKFCMHCGEPIKTNNELSTINNNVENNKKNITPEVLGMIAISLYFLGSTIFWYISRLVPESMTNYISCLSGVCPLAGIVIMIIGRIKYPNNVFLKIIMWIIIASIIAGLVLFIIFVIWCYITCKTTDWSKCG